MGGRDRGVELLLAGYAAFETVRGVVPELLAVLASVAINVGVDEPFLATALNAGFFATAFYVFTPLVFPEPLGDRRERTGFRLVVVVVSLLFAAPVSLALATFDSLSVSLSVIGGYLTVAVAISIAVFALYFRLTQQAPLWSPDGDSLALVVYRSEESPAEYRQTLRRLDTDHPRVARFLRGISTVAAMSSYTIPCILFGVAAAALNSFFPLLEVLVFAGLTLRAGGRLGIIDRPLPDVESRFYDRITTATRSVRGVAGVLMAVVSLLLAAFLVAVWVTIEGYWLGSVTNSVNTFGRNVEWFLVRRAGPWLVVEQWLRIVESIGHVVALPLSSGYAMWYWYVELRRLTAIEGTAEWDFARPPGFALPAVVLVAGWQLSLGAARHGWPVDLAFAVAWPLATLGAVWSVYRTRSPPDDAGTATALWAIPLAFVVYAGGVILTLVAALDIPRQSFIPIGVLPWLFYLDSIKEVMDGLAGRLLSTGYVLLPLLVAAAFRDLLDIGAAMLGVLAGVVAVFVLGQVLTHRYEETS